MKPQLDPDFVPMTKGRKGPKSNRFVVNMDDCHTPELVVQGFTTMLANTVLGLRAMHNLHQHDKLLQLDVAQTGDRAAPLLRMLKASITIQSRWRVAYNKVRGNVSDIQTVQARAGRLNRLLVRVAWQVATTIGILRYWRKATVLNLLSKPAARLRQQLHRRRSSIEIAANAMIAARLRFAAIAEAAPRHAEQHAEHVIENVSFFAQPPKAWYTRHAGSDSVVKFTTSSHSTASLPPTPPPPSFASPKAKTNVVLLGNNKARSSSLPLTNTQRGTSLFGIVPNVVATTTEVTRAYQAVHSSVAPPIGSTGSVINMTSTKRSLCDAAATTSTSAHAAATDVQNLVHMSDELILLVFSFLTPASILKTRQLSKAWAVVSTMDRIWQPFCVARWRMQPRLLRLTRYGVHSYLGLYRHLQLAGQKPHGVYTTPDKLSWGHSRRHGVESWLTLGHRSDCKTVRVAGRSFVQLRVVVQNLSPSVVLVNLTDINVHFKNGPVVHDVAATTPPILDMKPRILAWNGHAVDPSTTPLASCPLSFLEFVVVGVYVACDDCDFEVDFLERYCSARTIDCCQPMGIRALSVWIPMMRRGDCIDLARCRCMLLPDQYHHFGLHIPLVDEAVIWNRYTQCSRGFMVLNAKDRLTAPHDLPARYLIVDGA
ncbi:hypothetical protein DYB31_007907 [Aphanomyces astaci]|uniref:F-box domain-containing protein n=1 Tax=Aphanomyces astaci TaxID=112090 RepID=A0A397EPQ0_APHAT|nr:hypothetical protein DYB31_007907 [Aphanomyces astaci]